MMVDTPLLSWDWVSVLAPPGYRKRLLPDGYNPEYVHYLFIIIKLFFIKFFFSWYIIGWVNLK
tara:strand:- start:210 stop:398 length:189 start_codon:yes stop_codon:yes gene_type:complete